jgi:hypothetical protein
MPKAPAQLDREIALEVGPGPRPTNPREISFDPRCFAEVGERTEYTVMQSALHSGPRVFTDRAEAEAAAKRIGRAVTECTVPIRKRIKWRP